MAPARSPGDRHSNAPVLSRVGLPGDDRGRKPRHGDGILQAGSATPPETGSAPLKFPLADPLTRPKTESDVVPDQVLRYGIERPEFLELAEIPTAPRGAPARRDRKSPPPALAGGSRSAPARPTPLGAPCFEPPLPHALLQDVRLRLAHRALQAQKQPIVVLAGVMDTVEVGDQRSRTRRGSPKAGASPWRSAQDGTSPRPG